METACIGEIDTLGGGFELHAGLDTDAPRVREGEEHGKHPSLHSARRSQDADHGRAPQEACPNSKLPRPSVGGRRSCAGEPTSSSSTTPGLP